MSIRSFAGWLWRHAGQIALVVACVGIAGGIKANDDQSKARTTDVSNEARARSKVDRARTAQVDWDAATARHRECLGRADSRITSRKAWTVAVDLLSRPRPGDTPERRQQTLKTVELLNGLLDQALAPLHCEKIAPAPKGPRPRIP